MGVEKKQKVEFIVYCIISVLMLIGFALVLSALLLPYWYKASYQTGIVKYDVDIGLYQDRVCRGDDCESFWLNDDDYDRLDSADMPKFDTIRGLELAGVINAGMGLLHVLNLWGNRRNKSVWRNIAQGFYFAHALVAGFLCVSGSLLLSSEASSGDIGFASIMAGAGSAFLFIPACLSCLVCRYDASYGTLENPISPAFRNA